MSSKDFKDWMQIVSRIFYPASDQDATSSENEEVTTSVPTEDVLSSSLQDENPQPATAHLLSKRDAEYIIHVNYIIEELMQKSEINADNVAQNLGVSTQTLRRKLKGITGMNPLDYINKVRIEKAKRLFLEQPELTIAEVSKICGFDEPTHFTRTFKHIVGVVPSTYKDKAN